MLKILTIIFMFKMSLSNSCFLFPLSYLRLLEGTQKNSKKTKGLQRKTQGDLSEKKVHHVHCNDS